jgi:hypothetical protein
MPRETRGVTPDELRAEIWHAVIHGVRGIIYFPQQFNPFVYDATPSPVSVELATQNRLLAEMGEGLASPANPKGLRITSRPPVEVGWRRLKSGKFCAILLNDSPTPVTQQDIHLVGDNNERFLVTTNGENPLPMADDAFTVDFSIYQVRIFTIEPLGQPPK